MKSQKTGIFLKIAERAIYDKKRFLLKPINS